VPHKSNFFFGGAMSQFDWPITKKNNVETMETPQNSRFYAKMECLALWSTYIGEKGRTLLKTYGIEHKVLLGTLLGNTLRTSGTCWEQRKNEKKKPPLPQT